MFIEGTDFCLARDLSGDDSYLGLITLPIECSSTHTLRGLVICREHAPSIIFMDEVDSIGSARTDNGGGGGDSEVQRTMLELLNQLDGFEATNKIKVGAAGR